MRVICSAMGATPRGAFLHLLLSPCVHVNFCARCSRWRASELRSAGSVARVHNLPCDPPPRRSPFLSTDIMGEGPRFPYPKQVWSPAGGWWPYPAKWRANTAATIVLIAAIAIPVAVFSEKNMVRTTSQFSLHLHPPRSSLSPVANNACVRAVNQITEGRPNRRIPWRPYLEPKEH